MPLIDNTKKFLEKQKQIRDENSHEHFYIHPILEIGNAIEDVLRVRLNKVDIDNQKNGKAIEGLKKDTNKLLSSGELVYRISRLDLPMTNTAAEVVAQNNFINTNTQQYFMELVDSFRTQMADYSEQIQTLKSYCATSNDKSFSYDEINQIIRRQHENFTALASKVYAIHDYANKLRVEMAKGSDTNMMEHVHQSKPSSTNSNQSNLYGPSPFLVRSTPMNPLASTNNQIPIQQQNQTPILGSANMFSNQQQQTSNSSSFFTPSFNKSNKRF